MTHDAAGSGTGIPTEDQCACGRRLDFDSVPPSLDKHQCPGCGQLYLRLNEDTLGVPVKPLDEQAAAKLTAYFRESK